MVLFCVALCRSRCRQRCYSITVSASQPHLFSAFSFILFNRLERKYHVMRPSPFDLSAWAVRLSVFLLVVHSSIHPSTSKQYTMFPRQVVIVTVLQRIIKVDLNVQYKGRGWREGQRRLTTLSTTSLRVTAVCCSSVPRTWQKLQFKPSFSYVFCLCFTPSLLGITFPLFLFYGRTDRRYLL